MFFLRVITRLTNHVPDVPNRSLANWSAKIRLCAAKAVQHLNKALVATVTVLSFFKGSVGRLGHSSNVVQGAFSRLTNWFKTEKVRVLQVSPKASFQCLQSPF